MEMVSTQSLTSSLLFSSTACAEGRNRRAGFGTSVLAKSSLSRFFSVFPELARGEGDVPSKLASAASSMESAMSRYRFRNTNAELESPAARHETPARKNTASAGRRDARRSRLVDAFAATKRNPSTSFFSELDAENETRVRRAASRRSRNARSASACTSGVARMESTSLARYDSVFTTAANASFSAFSKAFSSSSANANAKRAISS
mmetsp:Transcript_15142/g.64826  ORF Transcript_15142/g.64826 Transcript_15142/m.64826 type:complete len:206 (-) Transcript_15142:4839-5456(-)